jgi:thiol-disulfide isomerase/thioredoxin
MRKIRSGMRVAAGVVLGALLVAGTTPVMAALLSEGTRAPDFTLSTLGGKSVKLSDYSGKPVLMEFWATWCGPCRQQFPKMARLHEKYEGEVHFLLINTMEDAATVRKFGEKVKIPGTILLDPEDRVGELYRTRILPSVFFLDSRGVIRAAVPGAIKDMDQFMERMMKKE